MSNDDETPSTGHETPTTGDERTFESAESYYAEYRPRFDDRPITHLVDRFDLDESRALDLGCGAGQIAIPLATRHARKGWPTSSWFVAGVQSQYSSLNPGVPSSCRSRETSPTSSCNP